MAERESGFTLCHTLRHTPSVMEREGGRRRAFRTDERLHRIASHHEAKLTIPTRLSPLPPSAPSILQNALPQPQPSRPTSPKMLREWTGMSGHFCFGRSHELKPYLVPRGPQLRYHSPLLFLFPPLTPLSSNSTNPSLILAAVKDPKYGRLIDVAVKYAKEKGG